MEKVEEITIKDHFCGYIKNYFDFPLLSPDDGKVIRSYINVTKAYSLSDENAEEVTFYNNILGEEKVKVEFRRLQITRHYVFDKSYMMNKAYSFLLDAAIECRKRSCHITGLITGLYCVIDLRKLIGNLNPEELREDNLKLENIVNDFDKARDSLLWEFDKCNFRFETVYELLDKCYNQISELIRKYDIEAINAGSTDDFVWEKRK